MGEHGNVAAGDLIYGSAHTLRHKTLQVGMDCVIVGGHDVGTRLRLPGHTTGFQCKQIGGRCKVSGPCDLLLLLGKVSGEILDSLRKQPDAPICNFDVRENFCDGKLVQLALRCLVGVRGESGDIDQPGDTVVRSCGCDHASPVRVAHKDGRAVDPAQCAFYSG